MRTLCNTCATSIERRRKGRNERIGTDAHMARRIRLRMYPQIGAIAQKVGGDANVRMAACTRQCVSILSQRGPLRGRVANYGFETDLLPWFARCATRSALAGIWADAAPPDVDDR